MKTYSFHYARAIIRFPVEMRSLQEMGDVLQRFYPAIKGNLSERKAETAIYWNRIQTLPKINHYEQNQPELDLLFSRTKSKLRKRMNIRSKSPPTPIPNPL